MVYQTPNLNTDAESFYLANYVFGAGLRPRRPCPLRRKRHLAQEYACDIENRVRFIKPQAGVCLPIRAGGRNERTPFSETSVEPRELPKNATRTRCRTHVLLGSVF